MVFVKQLLFAGGKRQAHTSAARERLQELLSSRLKDITEAGTFKHERVITSPQHVQITVQSVSKPVLNFCANNYLGLANHPDVVAASTKALRQFGAGLSSVRFICGTQTIHKELETSIAKFHGREDAILYGSCFDANAGLFEAILGPDDAVFSDALNHASIIDGIRLCKAKKYRFKNRDTKELDSMLQSSTGRLKLIVTDGVFSMDGTVAPLAELVELAEKHEALLFVDECHATGFFGENGRGTEEYCGVEGRVDIINSTLGKALGGASGGYTCGPQELVDLLRNISRPYLFSNAPPPTVVAGAAKALEIAQKSPELRARLRDNAHSFRRDMRAAGFTVSGDDHPICPVMIGDAVRAAELAAAMLDRGVYVIAFSYPVVAQDAARVRVQLSATHKPEQLKHAVDAFTSVGRTMRLI